MPRDTYNAVTFHILFGVDEVEAEGRAFAVETETDENGENYSERQLPVRRFTKRDLAQATGRAGKISIKLDFSRVKNALRFVALILALKKKDKLASEKALVELTAGIRTHKWHADVTK